MIRPVTEARRAIRWCWLIPNAIATTLTAAAVILANDNAWTVWAVGVAGVAQGALALRLTGPKLRAVRRLLAELSEGSAAARP
jgi:hypothetical protein